MGGNLYEKPTVWTKNEKNITFSIIKQEYRLLVKVKVKVIMPRHCQYYNAQKSTLVLIVIFRFPDT